MNHSALPGTKELKQDLFNVLPAGLTKASRSIVEDVSKTLSAVCRHVTGKNAIDNELEEQCVVYALRCAHLLGDRKKAEALAKLLAFRKPVPIILAKVAIEKGIKPQHDLVRRLS